MNRLSRRTVLKLFGGVSMGIGAQFAGFLPEVFGARGAQARDLSWRELNASELNEATSAALLSAEGSQLSEVAKREGFQLRAGEAHGIRIDMPTRNGTLVFLPYASGDGLTAQLMFARTDGLPARSALGVIDARREGTITVSARQIENGTVQLVDTTTVEGDTVTVVDHRTGTRRTVKVPQRAAAPASSGAAANSINFFAVAAADSCSDCLTAFDFLYGLGCSIGSFLLCLGCTLLTGPAGLICGLVCAVFWFLVCYLAIQLNRCYFCRVYTNYCTSC